MQESTKLGFEFARDLTNQLITLSTGVVAFTVTFSKDFLKDLSRGLSVWLVGAWVLHLLSIGLGFVTLMTLTGTLLYTQNPSQKWDAGTSADPKIGTNVLIPSQLQQVLFLLGTVAIVIYGIKLTRNKLGSSPTEQRDTAVRSARSSSDVFDGSEF